MFTDKLVREWMTPNPITATPETTLPEAYRLMMENRIRRLPVVDGEKLVGIVTLGDVRGAQASEATSLSIWELNYLLSKLTVGEIMSRPVVTAEADMTVGEAARLMLDHRIAGLPVLENGRLVGIITESDIFRLVVEAWESEKRISA